MATLSKLGAPMEECSTSWTAWKNVSWSLYIRNVPTVSEFGQRGSWIVTFSGWHAKILSTVRRTLLQRSTKRPRGKASADCTADWRGWPCHWKTSPVVGSWTSPGEHNASPKAVHAHAQVAHSWQPSTFKSFSLSAPVTQRRQHRLRADPSTGKPLPDDALLWRHSCRWATAYPDPFSCR